MDSAIVNVYGNQVRVRACGVCWKDSALLMVNHLGLTEGDFWSPPGGGVEFGHTVPETLRKEFLEETGLRIRPGRFMFGCEYINEPIHSIELFYEVVAEGGELRKGSDPELQIIEDVKFMEFEDVKGLPVTQVHGIFRLVATPSDFRNLTGFYRV